MSNPTSQPRVLIAAFQGWSDAGDATTEVLQHLGGLLGSEVMHVISSEGYVDLQVHRPKVFFDENGERDIEWPDTRLYGSVQRPGASEGEGSDPAAGGAGGAGESGADGSDVAGEAGERADDAEASDVSETLRRIDGTPVTDLFLLAGVEPARDWQNFADEIVELVESWEFDRVILIGSMYSDSPHSRPIATTISSENPALREEFGAKKSNYEGPAGITTVIDMALTQAGIAPISLWAQVPHYVHSTPSPKATLALLDKLEELLDIVIPRGELFAQANEWEANINRIASADEEMSRYIRRLEESRDDAMAAEATGDAIALEFEKFLEGGMRRDAAQAREVGTGTGPEGKNEGGESDDPDTEDPDAEDPDADEPGGASAPS
ncbi:PAC2 family protein [Leucobacter luti]|uniref:PAC2 family protein n=1 Tax=Leucobacter luti TaxID=340320 RepID=UPI003D062B51